MRSAVLALLIVIALSPAAAQKPLGYAEIQVSTDPIDRASPPDVTMDRLGTTGLIWKDQFGLLYQRYDSAGQPDGTPQRIAASSDSFGAQIGFDDARRATLIWYSENAMRIQGRRLAADGQPMGDIFTVASLTEPLYDRAVLAVAPDGTFLVAWIAEGEGTLYARRLAADGTLLDEEIIIDRALSFAGYSSFDIVVRDDGAFAVSWIRFTSAGLRSFIRFFDAQGQATGNAFELGGQVFEGMGSLSGRLSAADGEVAVAYAHFDGIMVRRFRWSGTPLGAAVAVSADSFVEHSPTLVRASTGDYLVIWTKERSFFRSFPFSHRLWGRWLAPDGTPRGTAFWLSPSPVSTIWASAATADGLGNVVVTHHTSPSDEGFPDHFFARRLTADQRAGTVQLLTPTSERFEGDTRAAFTAVRSGGSDGRVTVRYRFAGGSATPSADYLNQEGVITFDDGETGAKSIAGIIREDRELDADETVAFTLSEATGGAELVAPTTTTLTLIDNDFAPTPFLPPASLLPPFQLNPASADVHRAPAAATHPSGLHAVAWIARDPFTDIPTVYARRFDRQGRPLGGPLTLGEAIVDDYVGVDRPSLTFDEAGGFLVVWGVGSLWSRYVDTAGRPQGEAVEFSACGYAYDSTVSAVSADTFAVVWNELGTFLTPHSVFFQLIGRQGETRSAAIEVSADAFDSTAAAFADGSFIILWKPLGEVGLRAQRFDAAGQRLGAPFALALHTSSNRFRPAVATVGVLALVAYQTSGPDSDVHAQLIGTHSVEAPIPVATEPGRQERPSVAMDDDGNAIVAWESNGQEGSGSGLYARRFRITGSDSSFDLRVMATARGDQRNVALTANPRGGDAFAVWEAVSPSGEVEIFGRLLPFGRCGADARTLCLGGGRFLAEVQWEDFEGRQGRGQAVGLTPDTGGFWFFGEDNIELVVKVLDGTVANDHHWVFYGALSNVAFDLTVTDLETGAVAFYNNPLGTFASVGDITALPALNTPATTSAAAMAPQASTRLANTGGYAATGGYATFPALPGKGSCAPDATTLCLGDGRFQVTSRATGPLPVTGSGIGQARPQTDDTGTFWFFGEDNIELIIKVLDGTAANGHHWIFYGALSNIGYEIRVTDTVTSITKTYDNPSGTFASVGDTMALPNTGP